MRTERARAARERTAEIIFGDETRAGRVFDVVLIVAIGTNGFTSIPWGATIECPRCALGLHEPDARYCRRCGERLQP